MGRYVLCTTSATVSGLPFGWGLLIRGGSAGTATIRNAVFLRAALRAAHSTARSDSADPSVSWDPSLPAVSDGRRCSHRDYGAGGPAEQRLGVGELPNRGHLPG
jgi:hypothetical protein